MLFFIQILALFFGACVATPSNSVHHQNESPISNQSLQRQHNHSNEHQRTQNEARALKKVFLSNRTITCNDGSQSGFYLRKSHLSKKWIIFLEGGWYCYDHLSCQNRWTKQRHYMTSSQWPETRDVGGILSNHEDENPYWWNANHAFIPYCTSDTWSGTKSERDGMFNFMGSLIVQQVVKDLVPLGLENSTDLLLAGSSAGGTGVMINLDSVRELLHETLNLKHIAVRGITDSGWFLDRTPYAPGKPTVNAIEKGMELWNGFVPTRCEMIYANEPWRCYFGYRLYPTLKAPLFVFQWLFDEAQMDADNVGAPVTKQQWDYIHKMGNALRKSFKNVSAVFAPSCISHSILTKRDWQQVKIDGVSISDALNCWERIPTRKNIRRLKNSSMISDQPQMAAKQMRSHEDKLVSDREMNRTDVNENKRRKKRKHRGNRKPKVKKNRNKNCGHKEQRNKCNRSRQHINNNHSPTEQLRSERSVPKNQRRSGAACPHRRLERCTWPQCNRSCPKLHNPYTGEEMDFIELLKSFGLDMESVAVALGIDMQTLVTMDHTELLNLLTQQAS